MIYVEKGGSCKFARAQRETAIKNIQSSRRSDKNNASDAPVTSPPPKVTLKSPQAEGMSLRTFGKNYLKCPICSSVAAAPFVLVVRHEHRCPSTAFAWAHK